MEATYQTEAIILAREPYRENDSRITVYSREHGKLELVARGAKKTLSKLSGHIEPVSLADIMVVRGRQYDYAGSATARNSFAAIKNDLDKSAAAGTAFKAFDKAVKPGVADARLFFLLQDFLELISEEEKSNYELFSYYFIYKLLAELGFRPNLKTCAVCGRKLEPAGNRFLPMDGGIVCRACASKPSRAGLRPDISGDAIKVLRLLDGHSFVELAKIKTEKKLEGELSRIITLFYGHIFG